MVLGTESGMVVGRAVAGPAIIDEDAEELELVVVET
jgi:hypothetical protein